MSDYSSQSLPNLSIPTNELQVDDIHTQYHPSSKRPAETCHFDEYCDTVPSPPTPTPEPWKPYFNTHEDFTMAKIFHEASLTQDQCNQLLSVVQSCIKGDGKCTLESYTDVKNAWEQASHKVTAVSYVLGALKLVLILT